MLTIGTNPMRTSQSGWPVTALLVVLAALAPARADFNTVTATLNTNNTLNPSAPVEINLGGGTSPSINYTPGVVNWTQTGTQRNSLLPTDFTTFCIELTQDISPGGAYTYTLSALQNAPNPGTSQTQSNGTGSGMGTTKATEIEYLWGTFYSLIGNNGDNAAAFQLAIWKIEYDWGDASLPGTLDGAVSFSSGNFQASPLDGDTAPITTATNWIKQLESGQNLTLDGNLVALTSSSYQDQIAQAAPVPSTLCLIGAGVLCLFGYGFTRRRAAVA